MPNRPATPQDQSFTPDWAVSPGTVLQAELEKRRMSQADLAARTGLTPKHINQVIKGSASLSSDVAVLLQMALGTPSSASWTLLEANWQNHRSHERTREQLTTYIPWADSFPLREMRNRGLPIPRVPKEDAAQWLLQWFQVAEPEAYAAVWTKPMVNFRRAQKYTNDPNATAVWLKLGESRAEQADVARWNPAVLRKNLPELRACITSSEMLQGFQQAQQIAASCGVAVVFVEEFAQTRASGATRWIGGNPLIVLSSRHKVADVFWFTLFHELGHALLHPKRSTYVDLDGKAGDDDDGLESEANEFAAETLIPGIYDQEICSAPIAELPNIAHKLEIDVCIVAGRRARMLNTPRQWQLVHKFRPNIDTAALEDLYA